MLGLRGIRGTTYPPNDNILISTRWFNTLPSGVVLLAFSH